MSDVSGQLKKGVLLVVASVLAAGFSFGFKYVISKDVGGACSEPNYCRGSLCVGATPYSTAKDGYCSRKCQGEQDCPAAYVCGEISVDELGHAARKMRVCLRR